MIKNIIFTGGGFKAWAYIGALKVLDEYKTFIPKNNIEQVIGVSAGAVFGLCYLLDISWDFLLDYFINLNFKEYLDIDIDNIITNQSILEGKKFTEILKELLSFKISPDITFKQLKCYSKILFTVNAINVSESKLEYFNYQLTPDIKVIDAVRASCNLPVIFPPYIIGKCLYYDGGICNNCPIDLVDELYSIALDVSHCASTNNNLLDLLNCIINMSNNNFYKNDSENIYHILDEKFKNQMVNFNQSRDDIFNIYMNGYTNSKNILFKNHIGLTC
jgi:NTE family protein